MLVVSSISRVIRVGGVVASTTSVATSSSFSSSLESTALPHHGPQHSCSQIPRTVSNNGYRASSSLCKRSCGISTFPDGQVGIPRSAGRELTGMTVLQQGLLGRSLFLVQCLYFSCPPSFWMLSCYHSSVRLVQIHLDATSSCLSPGLLPDLDACHPQLIGLQGPSQDGKCPSQTQPPLSQTLSL